MTYFSIKMQTDGSMVVSMTSQVDAENNLSSYGQEQTQTMVVWPDNGEYRFPIWVCEHYDGYNFNVSVTLGDD